MKRINHKLVFLLTILFALVLMILVVKLLIGKNNFSNEPINYNNNFINAEINGSINDTIDTNNQELMKLIDEYNKSEISHLQSKSVTFAIMGTDERASEISRSDILMVVKYDPVSKKINIVSIPRDTRVEIPGVKTDKINHAYAFGGAELSMNTLENLFGITIDYYVKFSFESFKKIIDDFGGVTVNAEKDFEYEGYVTVPKGENVLNGNEALFYVRYRNDASGDMGRIERQQEVVQALSKTIHSYDKEVALPLLFHAYSEDIETSLAFTDMLAFYKLINMEDNLEFNTNTLKTEPARIDKIWYEIINEGDLERIIKLLRE